MKVFGVDTALKWIDFEMEGKEYFIHFQNGPFTGIKQVAVYVDGKRKDIRIGNTYPPFWEVAKEIWRVWIPNWFRRITRYRR